MENFDFRVRKEFEMLDSIHKMFLAGVGLAAMTKDKIDEHVKELVEKGKLTEKEGREVADEMLSRRLGHSRCHQRRKLKN